MAEQVGFGVAFHAAAYFEAAGDTAGFAGGTAGVELVVDDLEDLREKPVLELLPVTNELVREFREME